MFLSLPCGEWRFSKLAVTLSPPAALLHVFAAAFFFPEVEMEGLGMTRNCSFFWTLFCTAMFFCTMGNTKRIGEQSSLTAVKAQVFHFIEACTLVPGISLQDTNVSIELQSMCIAPSAFCKLRNERQKSHHRNSEATNLSGCDER